MWNNSKKPSSKSQAESQKKQRVNQLKAVLRDIKKFVYLPKLIAPFRKTKGDVIYQSSTTSTRDQTSRGVPKKAKGKNSTRGLNKKQKKQIETENVEQSSDIPPTEETNCSTLVEERNTISKVDEPNPYSNMVSMQDLIESIDKFTAENSPSQRMKTTTIEKVNEGSYLPLDRNRKLRNYFNSKINHITSRSFVNDSFIHVINTKNKNIDKVKNDIKDLQEMLICEQQRSSVSEIFHGPKSITARTVFNNIRSQSLSLSGPKDSSYHNSFDSTLVGHREICRKLLEAEKSVQVVRKSSRLEMKRRKRMMIEAEKSTDELKVDTRMKTSTIPSMIETSIIPAVSDFSHLVSTVINSRSKFISPPGSCSSFLPPSPTDSSSIPSPPPQLSIENSNTIQLRSRTIRVKDITKKFKKIQKLERPVGKSSARKSYPGYNSYYNMKKLIRKEYFKSLRHQKWLSEHGCCRNSLEEFSTNYGDCPPTPKHYFEELDTPPSSPEAIECMPETSEKMDIIENPEMVDFDKELDQFFEKLSQEDVNMEDTTQENLDELVTLFTEFVN